MNLDNLRSAFRLLSRFKSGEFKPGTEISNEQVLLLDALCNDLLPGEVFSLADLDALIYKMVCVDDEWNKKSQIVIDQFYALSGMGKMVEAHEIKSEFIGGCPSLWYREIVENL